MIKVWVKDKADFVDISDQEWLTAIQMRWSNPDHGPNKEYREGFLNAVELFRASWPDVLPIVDMVKLLIEKVSPVVEKNIPVQQSSLLAVNTLEKRVRSLEKLLYGSIKALRGAGKEDVADKIEKALENLTTDIIR